MKPFTFSTALGLALISLPTAGLAYNSESTAAFATWSNGGYVVANDVWGSNPGPETIWANSFSNWGVFTSQGGHSIASYPHVEFDNINTPVNSLGSVQSSFNATTPSGCVFDQAYDIWLNSFNYEVMIWESWSGTQPIAKSYNSAGQAVPTYSNVTISGVTYNVYTGTGGSGPCMSFLRTTQVSSGTVDIAAILKWINTTGWYNNPTLSGIQDGWEITNTAGVQKNFTMNSYSVTIGSGGGGGGGSVSNGTYKIINRNSGLALDVVGAATGNSAAVDQWPYGGNSNQRWTVTSLGGGQYEIIGVGSGKSLDVCGAGTANGTEIDIYSYSGNSNQRWTFTATSSGYYRISPVSAPGSSIDVTGNSTAQGAAVELWSTNGGNNQQWILQAP
ncbi:MAG TPA: RICIN domain-containing protein [Opitutaceae bacterium]